jgi:hypothetical protein
MVKLWYVFLMAVGSEEAEGRQLLREGAAPKPELAKPGAGPTDLTGRAVEPTGCGCAAALLLPAKCGGTSASPGQERCHYSAICVSLPGW